MAAKIQNMTEGKPVRLIITFALPLMLGNIFQQLYTMVDTIIVGQALGVNALAALGASDGVNWLILSIVQGFTQGFSIKIAQEFGAGQHRKLCRVIGNSIVMSAIIMIILTALSQLICRPVLVLMQTPEAIIEGSVLYLRVVFIGIPVIMAYNFLAAVLRALGDGKTPLNAMIVASFVNIALDLLFVLVFHWGIAGAAAATVLAQVCSALFCLNVLRKIDVVRLNKEDFRPELSLCVFLMKLGSPMAFQNAIIALGCIVLQYVVNGFGVLFVAGLTATNKLYGLLEVAATSYGYAMVTYVGQNLGARRTDRISKGMRSALVVGVITACVIMAGMLIFGKEILGMFISGSPKEVEQTLYIAYYYLAVMSVSLPILYVLHVVRSALQGMGDTVRPMISGIAEMVMRIGAAFLLPTVMGEFGVFYAEPLAWLGADFILIPSYLMGMKRLKGEIKMVKSRLWQYSTVASRNMEPFAWQAAGMGYVIHTAANRFIVIDGGHGEDAEPLIRLMQRESGETRPEVALWILSHPHDDHADALINIAHDSDLKNKVQINAVAFNLPKDFPQNKGADCEMTLRKIHEIPDDLGCQHICPKTDDSMEVDGLKFTFFFCQEDMYCVDPNELSLVFRVSGKNLKKTVMFTGDAYPKTLDTVMGKFTSDQLQSDICQAAHHGLNGGSTAFYRAVDAKTVLVPIAKPAFDAMLYGEYKDDPQADANRALMLGAMKEGNRLFRSADGDFCIELE